MILPPLPSSIALHIGAHKTASSHLQNVLYRNRDLISEAGIRVYGPGYLRMKGRNLAAMFGMSWSESPAPRRTPEKQLAFLAKGRERLVFSEENFVGTLADSKGRTPLPVYPQGAARIAELVGKWAPIETDLYLGIRNQASFLESAYSQALMGGAYIGPRMFCDLNDWQLIDWADYVAQLRAIDGIGTIYIWCQETYDEVHPLLLRVLLSGKVARDMETVPGRVNRGMSAAAVRQTLEWAQAGKDGTLAREAKNAFPIGPEHGKFDLYTPATLADAQGIYDGQIARIADMDGVHMLGHLPDAARG